MLQSMRERFSVQKKDWAKKLLEEAAKENHQDTIGSRQKEWPNTEELELLREVMDDLRFDGSLMRQPLAAGKLGDWAGFLEDEKLSVRASVKVRECHNEVEQEDEIRKTVAQQILQKNTDFLRRIIVPVEGQGGGLHCRVCAHIATGTLLKTSGGFVLDTERITAICVRRAAASTLGRPRTESWSYKTGRTAEKQRCFENTLRRKEFATT